MFISLQVTGTASVPQIAFGATAGQFDGSGLTCSPELDQIQIDLGFAGLYTQGTKTQHRRASVITLALMVGTAGLPHVIVRFFTVPRGCATRGCSAGWALLFIAVLYTGGACGRRTRPMEPHRDDPAWTPWAAPKATWPMPSIAGVVSSNWERTSACIEFAGQER